MCFGSFIATIALSMQWWLQIARIWPDSGNCSGLRRPWYNWIALFKASALWADAFYKSKCPSVCLSSCPSVRLFVCSLFRYRLNVFLPPFPEVGCPIFLEIRNPLGKVFLVHPETTLPDGLETSGRRV